MQEEKLEKNTHLIRKYGLTGNVQLSDGEKGENDNVKVVSEKVIRG